MEILIGKHTLGSSHPVFIVAEMSANHGNSLNQALDLIKSAKRAGANAIKLQTYTPDTITIKSNKDDFKIPKDSPWAAYNNLWDLYKDGSTPWEWHDAIFTEARKLDLEVFSSVFDESSVDFLESLNAPAYKIASLEITDIPLLEKTAKTQKPVIISTGVGDLNDIELAIKTLRKYGNQEIIVLQCTSSYPAPPEEANLLTIPDLVKRFGVIAGLSDHTIGAESSIAAVALGASFIEKHFKIEHDNDSVDSFFSMGENEFSKMVKSIRLTEQSLGKPCYEITPSAEPRLKNRRSLYVIKPIKQGEVFTEKNIKSVRPALGLHPKYYRDILGKKSLKNLEIGDRLSWENIE